MPVSCGSGVAGPSGIWMIPPGASVLQAERGRRRRGRRVDDGQEARAPEVAEADHELPGVGPAVGEDGLAALDEVERVRADGRRGLHPLGC
jgi:hypothetical protein